MITEIGEYRLLEQIGEGAAGIVYLATPMVAKPFARPGDPLAVKVYKPEILKEPKQFDRIRREFKIGSQLSHPNIVRIYDFSIENPNDSFLVMEYVDGVTLDKWLHMFHPISERLLLHILMQLIEGVCQLHESGVIHRDIKPKNIMLSSSFEAKIMDLGVVRITKDTPITPPDKFVGTIRNSSPEMLFGSEYDERTDLYSLGTIIYALLHGEEVFAEENQFARLIELIKNEEPKYNPSLTTKSIASNELLELTKSLLQKEVDNRPSSAVEIKDSLEKIKISLPSVSLVEPLHGYVATALTGLEDDSREAIVFVSDRIAEVAKEHDIYVYQPRKATDPLLHSDIEPAAVYSLDRKRVIDADVLFILANKPSFGVGQEIEIAGSYGKPVILLKREGIKVSRMVTGSFANLLGDITYDLPEDLQRKLRGCLRNNIEKMRSWKKNAEYMSFWVGHNLTKYREQVDYTLEEAAAALGISEYFLSYIEKQPLKYHNIGLNIILRISQLYSIRPQDILGLDIILKTRPVKDDHNILRLEKVSKKLGWSASDFLELREEYLKEIAASGSSTSISDEEWRARHNAFEERRLKEGAPIPKDKQNKLF